MSKLSQFKQSQNTDFPNVRPSLDLRFALAKKLDPRITFTRGSTGTYFGSDGLMRTADVNEPRFDHDPVTGQSLGLLIEESRTNLVTDSIILSNFTDKTNATVVDNSIISPDGTQNASRIQEIVTATITGKNISRLNVTTAANTAYTISGYFKAGERTFVALSFRNNTFWGTGVPLAIFNLATGTLFSTTGTINATSITYVGNGWYRCSVTATRDSNGTVTSGISITIHNQLGVNAFNGASGYGLYAWGIQMEAGAFPTSFIRTSGSTVTRSQDNASMTGTNFSSWYNQSEGTLSVSTNAQNFTTTNFPRLASIDRGNATTNFIALVRTQNINRIEYSVYSNGIGQAIALRPAVTFASGSSIKAICTYNNNYFIAGANGVLTSPDISGLIPTSLSTLGIGMQGNGTLHLNGTISRLTYYPIQLTNQQLINLTS